MHDEFGLDLDDIRGTQASVERYMFTFLIITHFSIIFAVTLQQYFTVIDSQVIEARLHLDRLIILEVSAIVAQKFLIYSMFV
jgi:hypothetical protein